MTVRNEVVAKTIDKWFDKIAERGFPEAYVSTIILGGVVGAMEYTLSDEDNEKIASLLDAFLEQSGILELIKPA